MQLVVVMCSLPWQPSYERENLRASQLKLSPYLDAFRALGTSKAVQRGRPRATAKLGSRQAVRW